ncbi:YkuS family protein [Desulfotruncus alcoholivorax]|uniref:YkuS family protein n=1 Tax=Desulfotruncus alcoholivorax TaxID=265477 RepID=UPI00041CDC71|nr:YkuS family protein [Desulfotruncus alcoholivorax]
MLTVALDDDLKRLRDDLVKEGFRVVDRTMADHADALIISGMEKNFMNMQDIRTEKKVIDASGKSVREIADELRGLM